MTPTERPKAYSLDAAAKLAGISRRTLYREIDRGRLQVIHSGDRQLIEPDALRAYIDTYRPYRVIRDDDLPDQERAD